VYDVVGDVVDVMRSSGGVAGATCLQNDAPSNNWMDPRPDPAPGSGYYYLVRAHNVCGNGTYGFATGGSERNPTSGCP
jgi:hypothetical protein